MKALALLLLLVVTPASAGGLILGLTSAGLLVPAAQGFGALPSCTVCDNVPPERPALSPMAPILFPSRGALLDDAGWREPADRAAYEALRMAQCLEGSTECLNWHPGGLQFSLAAVRARP